MHIYTYICIFILIPSGGHIRKWGRRCVQERRRWYMWMYIYICSRSIKVAQERPRSLRVLQGRSSLNHFNTFVDILI